MKLAFDDVKLNSTGKKFMAELEWLGNRDIYVGYIKGEHSYPDGTDVADVAIYNEFGTSRIPARPFLEQTFRKHKDEYIQSAEEVYGAFVKRKDFKSELKKFGEKCKQDVRDEIDEGDFTPNAPSTIARKGFNHPLYETGLLKSSVVYRTKKRGE